MSPEILELFIPIVFLLIVGALIGLRMLKPYGDRILDLIQEMNRSRQTMLEEERALQQIHDRLDMLAERQDFLESLVENRLEGEAAPRKLAGEGRERDAPSADRGDAPHDREDGG